MTVIAAPAKVLVTGANGFIAVWIVQNLVEQGYAVRGTVRSAEKGEFLVKKFGDKFEYAIVQDITKEGAFDDAVQGVDAVLHTAAPVTFSGTYDAVVKVAIASTLSVLKSILSRGTSVRRVVVTSSYVTLLEPHEPTYHYTEADWNDTAVREANEKRDNTPGILLYYAAKTAAERAAWDFAAQHKSEIGWDMVTLLPPMVFGPTIHDNSSEATQAASGHLSSTNFLYNTMFVKRSPEDSVKYAGRFADVRDIARAHVLALQKEEAGGERFILASGAFSWQAVHDAVAGLFPDIPKGHPEAERVPLIQPDASKAARVLGVTDYITLEQTARDTVLSVRGQ